MTRSSETSPRATSPAFGNRASGIHILVVDDEADVRETVRDYLVQHGYTVSTAEGGVAMREVMKTRPVHIVIVDLRMPGESGLSLARSLREAGGVGVIMLTASAEMVDRIVGLEVGADDYIAKPFDPRELLARVRSLVRRLGIDEGMRSGRLGREVRFGRVMLNLDAKAAYDARGGEVALTSMEFDLLKVFSEHPNEVMSRERLLVMAEGVDADSLDRSIDVRMLRLRRKVEDNPDKPSVLKTVRGVGYVFDPQG